ncbi:MAG: DNA repair protein RadC [Treponema sp.]|nr:DNA repair protein RadC [Treponema sp.]
MEQNEKAYEEVKQSPCIRELAMQNGLSFPSDRELLMLILGSGTREVPVESLARRSLEVIRESPPGDLVARLGCITGMGRSKALAVAAALELGRRMSGCLRAVVNRPSEIIPYVKHYAMECREHFVCVSLNGAHEIMAIRVVSIGSTSRALIHPREVLADPVAEHASALICCHNHPFGSCQPSISDSETTRVLKESSELLGISFLDHIIISRDDYFSCMEHGMLV